MRLFRLRRTDTAALYLLVFVVASYVVMANVRYGMNLRYANMWDMSLLYLSVVCLTNLTGSLSRRPSVWLALGVAALCVVELRQYEIFFVKAPLYELAPEGLLRAVKILK